jgi:hypothetical protein
MNLIEALKTGKAIRRSIWEEFYSLSTATAYFLPVEDILAEDWEVEVTSVELTSDRFDTAWERAAEILLNRDWPYEPFKTLIKRELGL